MAVITLPDGKIWGSSRGVFEDLLEEIAELAGDGSLRQKLILEVKRGYAHFDMSDLSPDEERQFASRLDEIVAREVAFENESEPQQSTVRLLVKLRDELATAVREHP